MVATRKPGQQLLEQFLQEKRAGLHNADVLDYPGMSPILDTLVPDKLIGRYTPTSASAYPSEITVLDHAHPIFVYDTAAIYNANNVTSAEVELLRSYQGLIDPRFRGRIAITAPTGGSTARNILHLWNHPDYGERWMKKLAAQKPAIINGGARTAEAILRGEYDVGCNVGAVMAHRAFNDGAKHLHAVYQDEFTPITPALTMLVANAPHPNAARLWIEWALSEQGQIVIQRASGSLSARKGITTPPSAAPWFAGPKNRVPTETAETVDAVGKALPGVVENFSRVFGWAR